MGNLHPWSRSFSIYCLYTGFYATGVVCGPFKSKISVPCSFIVFLHVFFVGFQSQVLYVIVFLLQDLQVGVPDMEHMELCGPFQWWILTLVRLFLPFLPILMLSLYSSLISLFTQCYVPLGGNYFMYTCIFVVSVGRGTFRVFCLETSGKIMLHKFSFLFINCTQP